MLRCFIFGALPVDEMPERPAEYDYIIAADKGYDIAQALGVQPDMVVGDFDSRGEAPDFANVVKLNVRKDDTDVGFAVKIANERGYRDLVIYGAVGGKLDHTFANIQIASDIVRGGGSVIFYGQQNMTVIRNGVFTLPAQQSGRISVFALSKQARRVNISGLSYELKGETLTRYFPLGVSNAFIGKPARISVGDGELLIIWENTP